MSCTIMWISFSCFCSCWFMSIRQALFFIFASGFMRVMAQWWFGIRDCRVIWEFGAGIAELASRIDRAVCMYACIYVL